MEAQTVDSGEEYLSRMNFRSLIEWLTAESLLSRPEDPLTFLRSILELKIAQRSSGEGYVPDDASSYIKNCYAEASASADEHGRILTRKQDLTQNTSMSSGKTVKRLNLLEKLISASRVMAMKLDPMEATKTIISETCRILECERTTLFLTDESVNELVLIVAEGAENIRIPLGEGIAGSVGKTGKLVNLKDVYSDPRFNPSIDMKTGYKTRTILCVPVRNGEGEIIGVMEAINKTGGSFTDVDEEVIGILASQAGIALYNAQVHKLAIRAKEKVASLLDIIRSMHGNLGLNSLMFTITNQIPNLVDCDRCTLYLIDRPRNEMWSIVGDVNIRVPLSQGIAGTVATTGQTINIKNAYDDPRFNKEIDRKSGYKTITMLTLSILDSKEESIGVLQVVNKTTGVFEVQDEQLLREFLKVAGPILENSQLFARSTHTDENIGSEFRGKGMIPSRSHADLDMNKIDEDEEGVEEN